MKKKWIVLVLLAPIAITILIAVGGTSVMLLWNWLLPTLFGWPKVTFWQAVGLLVLCRILFGASGRHGWRRSDWSDEQRARFRKRMRERLGLEPSQA